MFQGVEDTIAWFARTQKTGFRLSRAKDDIAEYFDPEASNESARARLEEELKYLRGGTYHIDAKNTREEPRKILSTDFIILPKGEIMPAAIGSVQSTVPSGYISRADMDNVIADRIALYTLREQNERLLNELENASAPKPSMMDSIGSILDHPMVKQLTPILIAKIMGGNIDAPQAYQVGIAGIDKTVEPVEPTENETEMEFLELTEDQETRLNIAFDDLVNKIGDIEETLTLIECLAPYIEQQSAMFNVIKGELLKYKK